MRKLYISVLSFGIGVSVFGQKDSKPNILWLTYEDTSPHFIGCYGNKQAHTPNVDKLANDGVRLTSAFSTAAVSSASRSCIITGVPATYLGTGNHRSEYKISEEIKGFPAYLRQAGYYTSNNSKTDYNVAHAKAFTQEFWDESSRKADWRKRQPGQPFFAVFNSDASHQSRTMTNTWAKYTEQVLSQLSPSEMIEAGDLLLPDYYRNSPEMQKHISRVYNSISLMDKEFGEWLAKLESDGLKDSTIIFCFSDHGQGITRAKGSAIRMGYQVPFILWIPPMYKHLSPWGGGVITNDLVSFDDLAPTMLHLAGAEIPEYMKGRIFMGEVPQPQKKYVFSAVDRTDESSELSRSVTDGKYMYTQVFMPFQAFVRWNMYFDESDLQQTIRKDYQLGLLNKTQASILEPRAPEYLYDIENDKWETVNLIDRPELKSKVVELRNVLINNLLENRDPHFMTEYAFIKSEYPPTKLASDNNTYPLKDILDVALLIGKGETVLFKQIAALNNPNKYIRYWATIGLFSQNKGVLKYKKQINDQAQKESFPPAKVTQTVLLYKIDSQYLSEVKQIIKDEKDPEILRMALHLIITLDITLQKPLLDDLKERLNIEKGDKGMFACQEYIRMIIHRLDGSTIISRDSF